MSEFLIWLVPIDVLLIVLFFYLGWFFNNKLGKKSLAATSERSKEILENINKEAALIKREAEQEAQQLKKEKLLEVKDEFHKKKVEFDNEVNLRKQKLSGLERQIHQKEESFEKRVETANQKEKEVRNIEQDLQIQKKNIETKAAEVGKLEKEQNDRLQKISGLTTEEAKQMLMENMVNDARTDVNKIVKEIFERAKAEVKKDAQKIIIQAIQRTAAEVSVESTVSVVQIQNDELKGRIIGKEGRNIRSFEAATGVDVIVDDTPEAVILSSYDMFRREVARISLERLIADGRIHPARIEEVVAKVQAELEEEMFKDGEHTALQMGIHGMHTEMIKLVGRMKYRSSYGQNLLQHSVEVSYLTGIMAAELGLDSTMAKRAGLLHDVGKTMDRVTEGPHALIGYDLAKRYREHPIICNSIGSHHDDMTMESAIAPLVQAADAISGARPGARREPIEGYVKRLETLELLAKSFDGVAKTYAIQAGREVRVVVEHEKIDDIFADKLAFDIARKIEAEMEYPGQIRVTVIREVRKVHIAK